MYKGYIYIYICIVDGWHRTPPVKGVAMKAKTAAPLGAARNLGMKQLYMKNLVYIYVCIILRYAGPPYPRSSRALRGSLRASQDCSCRRKFALSRCCQGG